MKKIIINILLICSIFCISFFIGTNKYEDEAIEKQEENIQISEENSITQENKTVNIERQNIKIYPKEEIIKEYKGYIVSAKLEIPKISLETYVLKNYSEKALKTSVTKLYGPEPNEVGNYCIAGHNYKNEIMFYNLRKVEKGDKINITDNKIGKIEYEIYNKYNVWPEDVSCLSQQTKGKKEITLITCTKDAKKRIIVKARQVEG